MVQPTLFFLLYDYSCTPLELGVCKNNPYILPRLLKHLSDPQEVLQLNGTLGL